ncbi:DUF3572 domain-containing protein [Tabrizicola aquatica]|uniref:DUF3572 domain-containing protein n=1 Tax=Tabrizicola aquatica TaxID=909926 RepID=UPI000CD1D5E5|nr:DUF3572 domain-containing protein [Tabrizicola aquatica]
MKTLHNQRESAQTLALRALAWLLADEELTGLFLNATGAGPADLRARALDADFHLAILDFLLMNDDWVVAFCDAQTLPYTAPMQARMALGGTEDWQG